MICLLGGEEGERESGEGGGYGFADTAILCTVQKHSSSCCSLFCTVFNTPTGANTIIHTHIFEFVDNDPITWNCNVLFVLIVLNLMKGQLYKC